METSTLYVIITFSSAMCYQRIELVSEFGILTSPHYPEPYSENTNISWLIKASKNSTTSIVITYLDIETNVHCKNNTLTITYGAVSKIFCHNKVLSLPITLSVTGIAVVISFTAKNNTEKRKGFEVRYSRRNKELCKNHDMQCVDGNGCYNSTDICDSKINCKDRSDELNCVKCPNNNTACDDHSSACFNPTSELCDGIIHCPHAEDEINCFKTCKDKIRCKNSTGCFTQNQLCDGYFDCLDKSDEINCTRRLCGTFSEDKNYFLCSNKKCINNTLVLNGIDDCGDFSDEHNGIKRETGFVLITVIFLTIGLCALIYHWCANRRNIYFLLQDLPEFPLPPFREPANVSDISCSIRFSQTDFLHGGEIYEAFVQSRHQLRHERSRGMTTATMTRPEHVVFYNYNPSSAAIALASLGITPESCFNLIKNECLEDYWELNEICLHDCKAPSKSTSS